MGNVDVRVFDKDVRQMIQSLGQIDKDVDARASAALKAGAEVLYKGIKEAAPVRSGQLKRAVAILPAKKFFGGSRVEVGIRYVKARYATPVEKGHAGPKPAPPHPFVEPTAEKLEDQVMDAVVKKLMEGL